MIVIAARPSMGKTSLAMNIAKPWRSISASRSVCSAWKWTADSLVLRMLCSRSRVNLRNIRDGFLASATFPSSRGGRQAGQRSPLHR